MGCYAVYLTPDAVLGYMGMRGWFPYSFREDLLNYRELMALVSLRFSEHPILSSSRVPVRGMFVACKNLPLLSHAV